MADTDWSELTAPLRRAAQALGASNTLLQRLGDDRGFQAGLRALSELPACITFHPFADTQQWSVDLEPDRQTSAEQIAERQAWSPRLTRQARRREQIGLVRSEAQGAGNGATATRGAESTALPATPPAARDGTTEMQPASRDPEVSSTGAWSALVQITQLLAALEPETARRASSPAAASSVTTRAARASARIDSAARDRSVGGIGAPASSVRPSRSAAASSTQAAASSTQTATQQPAALLEQYVAMLWSDAKPQTPAGPAREAARSSAEQPSATGPAPRAASLLLPPRPQGEAQSGAAVPPKDADAALAPLVWPANDAYGEESVEERLNRALLEQAWLRGVDLT
jgi:hypothetical protein